MPQKTLITAFLPLSATVGSFGQNFAHTTNEVGHHGDTITFHLLQIHLRMSSVPWVNKKFPVNEPFANWKSRFFIGKSMAIGSSFRSFPHGGGGGKPFRGHCGLWSLPRWGASTRWAFKMGFIVIEKCDLIVVNHG